MADHPLPPTGATRFELIDLERRIGDRGLQLRGVPKVVVDYVVSRATTPAQPAIVLTDYETALIRAALLAMARLAP